MNLQKNIPSDNLYAKSEQWVEVEPLVFRPEDGLPSRDSRVFGRDRQVQIRYLFLKLNPTTSYEKVAWHDEANFNFALLGACILLFMFLASPTEAEFIYAIPPWQNALFAAALIAAALALGSALFAVLAWKNGYWSIVGRMHYTLVVLALLAFVLWLNNWNLLEFRF